MDNRTETDHFILAQANAVLFQGEHIVTWAYLVPVIAEGGGRIAGAARSFVNAATKNAAFAVVTSQRVLLVNTRIGAFAPLLENVGVQSLERASIRGVAVAKTLLIELGDGQMLEYQVNRSTRYVSTQEMFFAQLESLLGRSAAARRTTVSKSRATQIATLVGIAIAVAYVAMKLGVH